MDAKCCPAAARRAANGSPAPIRNIGSNSGNCFSQGSDTSGSLCIPQGLQVWTSASRRSLFSAGSRRYPRRRCNLSASWSKRRDKKPYEAHYPRSPGAMDAGFEGWLCGCGFPGSRSSENVSRPAQAGHAIGVAARRDVVMNTAAPNLVASAAIRLYQRAVAPFLPGRCRFYPSCSEYALECFHRFSFFKALGLTSWRIARCTPLSRGYFDPVPNSEPGGH
jgi:putative membrane protein insertion efficiency factor